MHGHAVYQPTFSFSRHLQFSMHRGRLLFYQIAGAEIEIATTSSRVDISICQSRAVKVAQMSTPECLKLAQGGGSRLFLVVGHYKRKKQKLRTVVA